MTALEAIEYIEHYTWSTTRLGLGRTKELLSRMGDPQKSLKFVHVAGSNGKGSTCAMLASVLRAAGYKTGLYTSPYIQDFCERMQVSGLNIPGETLAEITDRVRVQADQMEDHPSQFELVTAIAMVYFLEAGCDIVVLEVGLGGALDSTNAIDAPEAAVITNLALEHTEYLGHTYHEIASAKAGIIKTGCSCAAYPCDPEAMETVAAVCKEKDVPLRWADFGQIQPISDSLQGQEFTYRTWKNLRIPLLGAHQLKNAAVALETIDLLRGRGWEIPDEAVRKGLKNVTWPARFEVLHHQPLFLLDGGHNSQCARALADCVKRYLPGEKITFLMGVLADKDADEMLQAVLPLGKQFFCLTPNNPRALTADALAEKIRALGGDAVVCASAEDGLKRVLQTGGTVVAFGSLYLAGELRTLFPKVLKQVQRRSCLDARKAIPAPERRENSRAICQRLLESEQYQKANTILAYNAFGAEADLTDFLQQAKLDGKRVCLPCCVSETEMVALLPKDAESFRTGAFGILEPIPEQSEVIPPEEIDLVVCPCAGFDEHRNRMGMGAGYYDRYLPKCNNASVIAAAYEAQKLPEICTDRHDRSMDMVITERKTY